MYGRPTHYNKNVGLESFIIGLLAVVLVEAVAFDGDVEVELLGGVAEVDVAEFFDAFEAVDEGVAVDVEDFGRVNEAAAVVEIAFERFDEFGISLFIVFDEGADVLGVDVAFEPFLGEVIEPVEDTEFGKDEDAFGLAEGAADLDGFPGLGVAVFDLDVIADGVADADEELTGRVAHLFEDLVGELMAFACFVFKDEDDTFIAPGGEAV